ncbi:uncharacterized protein PG986_008246 [Apiospora aurea]|uniref:Uncharacterized protein n=1 Tax=Apiospora aurea TaxID=335848 RepID=A0ABR1QF83_9PEZI
MLLDDLHAKLCVWNYPLLSSVLQPSKKTLRHLAIGQMGRQDGFDDFDVHDLGALETLAIAFPDIPRPADACRLWLTPTLRVLTIELCAKYKEQSWMFYSTEDARDWAMEFSTLAAAYKSRGEGDNPVALWKVELVLVDEKYEWEYEDCKRLHELEDMETANQAILDAGFGIKVPDISAAEWKVEQQKPEH